VEKMKLDVSRLTSVESRTRLMPHAELSFNVAATFPEASALNFRDEGVNQAFSH